ncbi:MAG: oligosaccharide flippase family protein [Thermoplasmata archaeon]|nr:oligosaccharide flippase family protein [Thermoplasmata archaeon]
MLARKSFLVLANNIVSSVLGFVSLLFIAHYMGSEMLGMLGFSLSYLGLFSFLLNLGFDSAHVKRISEGKALDKCMGTYFVIKLVLMLITSIVALAAIALWRAGYSGEDGDFRLAVMLVILAYYLVLAGVQMIMNTFNARREIAKSQVAGVTQQLVRTPMIIVVAVLLPLGVMGLAYAYLLSALASLAVGMMLMRHLPLARPSRAYISSYFKFAIPVSVVSSAGLIAVNVDKVMLGLFNGNVAVGHYFGAQGIVQILLVIPISLNAVLFPTISHYLAKKKMQAASHAISLSSRYLTMVMMPIVVFFMVYRVEIVRIILGQEFVREASVVLLILSVFTVMAAVSKVLSTLLTSLERLRTVAKIAVSTAGLNILLNLFLIPDHLFGLPVLGLGPVGAALATLISAVFANVAYRFSTRRFLRRPRPRLPLHIIAGLLTGIFWHVSLLALQPSFVSFSTLFLVGMLAAIGLVGLGIYVGVLAVAGEFTRHDLRFFLSMLHPGEMGRYIRDELRGRQGA